MTPKNKKQLDRYTVARYLRTEIVTTGTYATYDQADDAAQQLRRKYGALELMVCTVRHAVSVHHLHRYNFNFWPLRQADSNSNKWRGWNRADRN
jgi:hypothetical protein